MLDQHASAPLSAAGLEKSRPESIAAGTAARPGAFYRPELDTLRFFAFLGVYILHIVDYPIEFLEQHHVPRAVAEVSLAIAQGGAYGVDVFFVLSAYLITELLLREKDTLGRLNVPAFYLRRVLRIWPLYFLAVLIAAYVPFFNPLGAFSGRYVTAFFLFLGNWSFFWFGWITSVAVPLWSVSIEEQFYLFWPPLVARLSRRGIAYAAVVMIVVANSTRLLAAAMHEGKEHLWGNTFAHLDSIAAGILVALWLRGRSAPLRLPQRIALIVFCLVCFSVRGYYRIIPGGDQLSMLGTLIGYPALVAGCVAILVAFIGMPLRSATLQYLGKISYGLYVYHLGCALVTDKLFTTDPGVVHALLRVFVVFGLTVAVSAVSYAIVERPFLNLKRRFAFIESRPV
jgi:peptidoglycan/LPS O-acetylase OafA/YrhL